MTIKRIKQSLGERNVTDDRDLIQAAKYEFFPAVQALLRTVNDSLVPRANVGKVLLSAAYTSTATTIKYAPLAGGTSEQSTIAGSARLPMSLPGKILRGTFLSNSAAGDTTLSFHVDGDTTALATDEIDVVADTVTTFSFGDSAKFSGGSYISLGVTPASSAGIVSLSMDLELTLP